MSKRWLPIALGAVICYLAADYTAARFESRLAPTNTASAPPPGHPSQTAVVVVTPTAIVTVGLASPKDLQTVLEKTSPSPTPVSATPIATPTRIAKPTPTPEVAPLPKLVGTVAGSGHSLAVLQWGEETRVCSGGDTFGGCQVLDITPYAVHLKDAQGQVHLMQLGANTPSPTPAAAPSKPPTPQVEVTPPPDGSISLEQIRKGLETPPPGLIIKPDAHGLKIIYSNPDNPLAQLGLRSGDVIVSLNGQTLTNSEDYLQLYQRLRNETTLDFVLERVGQTVKYTIHLGEN